MYAKTNNSVAVVPNAVRVCAASLARKVYLRQKLGVGGLRKHYGGKNKRKVCAGQQPSSPPRLTRGEDCYPFYSSVPCHIIPTGTMVRDIDFRWGRLQNIAMWFYDAPIRLICCTRAFGASWTQTEYFELFTCQFVDCGSTWPRIVC